MEVSHMALLKRESKAVEPLDVFSRLDKMFDEWTRSWPFYGALEARWPRLAEELIRVDEYREDSTVVIRAELPGIDPEQDVELTLSEGMLHIEAQRRTEEKEEEKGYLRRELRYGSFSRTVPLPEGVSESDISASYTDGILEIRVALPEAETAKESKQIPVSRS
jgi:HSP20 family protein